MSCLRSALSQDLRPFAATAFPLRARTGFAHYIVTAKGGRETAKAKAFKAWLKAELAESMAALDAAIGPHEPAL